ncbi:hypothetical protein [Pimelobacter simplex]|uniref:hypothetical protein n=1 Tax=Nocardioides simplex TaxID=2045 RepID=UPI003AAB81E5
MKLIRSWPINPPKDRARVKDGMERFMQDKYDYRGLADYDDDIVLIEWDVAVDRDELVHFIEHARREPDRPLGAPFKLFRDSAYGNEPEWPEGVEWVWPLLHWKGEGSRPGPRPGDPDTPGSYTEMAQPGDPTCNGISFGLVYLPRKLLRAHEDAWPGRVADVSFSVWHYENVRPDIPICWHVRPAHLHYDLPTVEPRKGKRKG